MNATLFPPNSSLFLGDLSKFCTEADLEKIFSQYGEINQIRIMRNTNTGKALSYGFISFMSNECAANAMEKLNGISLHGRSMRIGWAAHNLKTHKTEEPAIINSVYVRFITPKTSEYVTEEVIHRAFDQFGSVVDVSIKQSAVDQRSGRQSGYGFVHFSADHAGMIAAFDALSRMNNNTYDGVTYSVEPSKNLLRQMDEMNLGVPGNRGGPRTNQNSSLQSTSLSAAGPQHQHQQSLYDRNMSLQSRMEPPYRPHQQQHQLHHPGRDDFHQMTSKLYQQQQQQQPSYMNHQSHHLQQQQGRYGQGMSQQHGNSSARYEVSGPGSHGGVSSAPYRQQQQAQFEPHAHRYAPSGMQQLQQQSYGREAHQQQEHLHSGSSMVPSSSSGGGAPSSLGREDLYARPHSYSQSLDPLFLSVLTSGPAHTQKGPSPRAISQTLSSSPSAGHVRNSSRDLDFASAVLAPTADKYVSSYVIEKPAIDDRYFDAPSKEPAPAPSTYSYGQDGSPPSFGEKHLASSVELQHHQAHGAVYTADRRGGLSSNSQSLYSHLPAGSVRPPHVPAQGQQQQQQHSRRPVNVTDLEIGRSRSMSSAGLPTYSTNATTDCEGGFFKSANSSFTEGANPRFAHLNSFGDFHNNSHNNMLSQGADTWTGISDQQSLLTREALQSHQPVRQPLTSSMMMRKLSMQSVTTNGGEEVNELVEDDYTFAAALATTHESASSKDSLFNYMSSNASSFALPSPPYGSSYTAQEQSAPGGLGSSLKNGCAAAEDSFSGAQQQQQYGSEMDQLVQEANHLSLSSVSSGNNTARSSVSDDKKPSPKSRQLPVTHFFKPVGAV